MNKVIRLINGHEKRTFFPHNATGEDMFTNGFICIYTNISPAAVRIRTRKGLQMTLQPCEYYTCEPSDEVTHIKGLNDTNFKIIK